MGINDAREQLEVCKDECGKLERENAELRQAMVELKPAEVLVEGSYFPVSDLPKVLGNFMRASDEYARDAKAAWAQVAELQAVIERVRRVWIEPGSHPDYHETVKDNLRREWPVMYSALQDLAASQEPR